MFLVKTPHRAKPKKILALLGLKCYNEIVRKLVFDEDESY